MPSQDIVTCFGHTATDPLVAALLKNLGVGAGTRLPGGEYDAYVEAPSRGVSLVFRDEGYLRGREEALGKSPLVLVGAHFYREGLDGYSEFQGALPMQIAFSDSREELVQKLGPSEWKRERQGTIRGERWVFPDVRVLVTYEKDGSGIAVVYCGIV